MSETDAAPNEAPEAAPAVPEPRPAAAPWRVAAIGLAAALALGIALVATAPWWAALLPWGPVATARSRDAALAARLDGLQAAQRQAQQQARHDAAASAAALQQLKAQVAAVGARAAAPAQDVADLRGQQTALSGAVADLAKRVEAAEKAPPAADIAAMQQRLTKLSGTVGGLVSRQEALDKAQQARLASDASDAVLALAVLQIRDAIAAGRPFAGPYATLAAAAHGRPEFAAAAQPLAAPAKTGVATRAALAEGLDRLAAADASDAEAPAGRSWREALLAQLRGLVRIRRLDGSGAAAREPQAVIDDARKDLAAGDLAGAVAALDKLSGPPAKAAAPWLQQANRRLAVDAVLRQVEALVASQLGAASYVGRPTAAGPPR